MGNGRETYRATEPKPAPGQLRALRPDHRLAVDEAAEQSVLGAVLVRPEILPEVAAAVAPADFSWPKNALIFRAMLDLQEDNKPVDLVTVSALLRERQQLDAALALYLAGLSEAVGFAVNGPHYARIVRDKAALRRLLGACREVSEKCLQPVEDVPAFLAKAGAQIMDTVQQDTPTAAVDIQEGVQRQATLIEQDYYAGKTVRGLSTGYPDMDRFCRLTPQDLFILGGRSGVGKTALALNMAVNAAQQGASVGVVSLEMPDWRIWRRIMAAMGSINATRLIDLGLTPSEWKAMAGLHDRLAELSLWIDSPFSLSISELRVQARAKHRAGGLDLLVVDYLQKLRPATMGRTREEEVGEIAKGLKALAKELHIPILALSPLNRAAQQRSDKRPVLSDLRESGVIEYESDVVLLMHRTDKEDAKTELLVEKNRHGYEYVSVNLTFLKHFQRFESWHENDI